jgi:tRNA-specific 2-thiouridylase
MDYKKNILYVVNDGNDKNLYNNKLIAKNVNWLNGTMPRLPLKCQAVIRYRHKPVKCIVTKNNKNSLKVKFSEPQRAITPGQSVVFYKKDEVLGGGIIC